MVRTFHCKYGRLVFLGKGTILQCIYTHDGKIKLVNFGIAWTPIIIDIAVCLPNKCMKRTRTKQAKKGQSSKLKPTKHLLPYVVYVFLLHLQVIYQPSFCRRKTKTRTLMSSQPSPSPSDQAKLSTNRQAKKRRPS